MSVTVMASTAHCLAIALEVFVDCFPVNQQRLYNLRDRRDFFRGDYLSMKMIWLLYAKVVLIKSNYGDSLLNMPYHIVSVARLPRIVMPGYLARRIRSKS